LNEYKQAIEMTIELEYNSAYF